MATAIPPDGPAALEEHALDAAVRALESELHNDGVQPGQGPLNMLNLDRPELDFVALARDIGVPGRRVEDVQDLMRAIEDAAAEPGPFLGEAII